MGKQSSLGPIDPQINGLPASGILYEFYGANREMKEDESTINIWSPVIEGYYPSLIESCKKALSWSRELAQDYLSGSMFYDELKKNSTAANRKIENIMDLLLNQDTTKSHNRHIPTPVCKNAGLKIAEIEADQELQDIVLSIHHASALTVKNTSVIKITENQNGKAYVSSYRG